MKDRATLVLSDKDKGLRHKIWYPISTRTCDTRRRGQGQGLVILERFCYPIRTETCDTITLWIRTVSWDTRRRGQGQGLVLRFQCAAYIIISRGTACEEQDKDL